jgi:hypothetical protein
VKLFIHKKGFWDSVTSHNPERRGEVETVDRKHVVFLLQILYLVRAKN